MRHRTDSQRSAPDQPAKKRLFESLDSNSPGLNADSAERWCLSRQERQEARIWPVGFRSIPDVVVSVIECVLDVLCDPEVLEDVVRAVQVGPVVHLEVRGISLDDAQRSEELSLERISVRVEGSDVRRCNLISTVVLESQVKLCNVVEVDEVQFIRSGVVF